MEEKQIIKNFNEAVYYLKGAHELLKKITSFLDLTGNVISKCNETDWHNLKLDLEDAKDYFESYYADIHNDKFSEYRSGEPDHIALIIGDFRVCNHLINLVDCILKITGRVLPNQFVDFLHELDFCICGMLNSCIKEKECFSNLFSNEELDSEEAF